MLLNILPPPPLSSIHPPCFLYPPPRLARPSQPSQQAMQQASQASQASRASQQYLFSYALKEGRARNPLIRVCVCVSVCLSVRVCGDPSLLLARCGVRACRVRHSAAVSATSCKPLQTSSNPFLQMFNSIALQRTLLSNTPRKVDIFKNLVRQYRS